MVQRPAGRNVIVYRADFERGDELPDELSRRERRLVAIEQAKQRLEAQQRELDDAKGRKPGQDRNPQGGQPYKRAYGEPGGQRAAQFHGSAKFNHED